MRPEAILILHEINGMKRVVIIGGGFAGLALAKGLAGSTGFQVTLVDRNNYSFFPPLLYQVATGYLEPSSICYPYRRLWRNKGNISFLMAEFLKVDVQTKKVLFSTGEVDYDYLVFAAGTRTNYFELSNVQEAARPMKTLDDALNLRNHFLQVMEQAARARDDNERKKLMTIVVAGAGPTGVEVSGMLAEMRKNVVPKDYPELREYEHLSHIYLVDGGKNVLAAMSERSQTDTHGSLTKMGVEIKLGLHVKDYLDGSVLLDNGETIEARTLVWAAGIVSSTYEGLPEGSYGRGKRLIVDQYNEIIGLQDVFAIGDTCLQVSDARFPGGYPQLAQVAIQQGSRLAKNLAAKAEGNTLQPFLYFDKGTMAIFGWNKAVVDLPKPRLHLNGFPAWLVWIFIHLLFLINYKNRIRTFYNWTTAYFSKDQSLRMIIRPDKRP